MARPTMTLEQEVLNDFPEEERSLGELQKLEPSNLTITQERNLFGDIVTAQPIRVMRDEARILKKMDVLGARNGQRYWYRYPVRNKRKGTVEYIEGPSVKCTDAAYMAFMNANLESRTVSIPGDRGGNYICYSRFSDYENGVSLTMGQLVPRSATLGGEDEERRHQIAHNVGQSKSRRNVVNAALGEYVHRAYMAAKQSLIDRIGRNIDKARETIVQRVEALGVSGLVARVEYAYGRRAKDFLATDIASVYAEFSAITDGMSSIDETWPPIPPPEPKRSDPETASPPSATPADGPSPHDDEAGPAATTASQTDEPGTSSPQVEFGQPIEVLGQEAFLKEASGRLGKATTEAEVEALCAANAERIAKLGRQLSYWNAAVRVRREQIKGGQPP